MHVNYYVNDQIGIKLLLEIKSPATLAFLPIDSSCAIGIVIQMHGLYLGVTQIGYSFTGGLWPGMASGTALVARRLRDAQETRYLGMTVIKYALNSY